MNSFLQSLEAAALKSGSSLLTVALGAAGPAVSAAVGGAAGPVAGLVIPLVQSLVTGVINQEKAHAAQVAAQAQNSTVVITQLPGASNPSGSGTVLIPVLTGADKKAAVLQQLSMALPLIEALAASLGHPIADPVALQIALGPAVDAVVASFNQGRQLVDAVQALVRAIEPKA